MSTDPTSIFELEACPKCGGKTGFSYRLTIRGTQFMPWRGSDGGAHFNDDDSKHGAYRCEDCNKIVRASHPPKTIAPHSGLGAGRGTIASP